MNHLAHCYLSFGDEDLLIGNFIGDFVKGNDWQLYPEGVQKGILLHRAIDSYTDNHVMTDKSMNRVRPFARRYAGPVIDVLYDHVLAINWQRYSGLSFEQFSGLVYDALSKRAGEMPEILQERLPRMLEADFLQGYATRGGMRFVMERFSRRLPTTINANQLLEHFFADLEAYSEDFNTFFPDLIEHARQTAFK